MLKYKEDCIDNNRKAIYECDCGNLTIAYKGNVNSGRTKSCGCYRKAATKKRFTKHCHKSNGNCSKAYYAWINMKTRCNNDNVKDYKNHYEKGIKYDEKWESFENFIEDMGNPKKHYNLDRINKNKGYSKENCRWKDSNVYYEINGIQKTLSEWCFETGVGRMTALKRIQRGVPIDIAIFHHGYLKL